ncbi:hypothetical protein ACFYNM_08375 [Streptomyces spororaveus]|uniref:hypothetical protein n=1 Tax=Streptomyces spororaveus TaxID=284039 RepID=UPI00369DD122
MRLRSTAAVFVGALVLALPTAGPSMADDHGERALGTLHYQYLDAAGIERRGQIRPADNDTCYLLTRTSRDEPAIEVRNDTESLAVLFDNRSCDGEAEKVLKPGERASRVEVVSVYFKPVDGEDPGRGDNGGNGGNGGNGTWPGRDDRPRDDEADEDQTDTGNSGNTGNTGNGGNGTWPGREDQTGQTGQNPDQSQNQNRDDEEEDEDFLAALFRALR